MLQRKQYKHVQHNDKSGKNLANLFKCNKEKSLISPTKDLIGNIPNVPQTINNFFRQYYCDNRKKNSAEIEQFLDGITFPSLTKDQAEILDAPLTSTEYEKALKKMSNNKGPGLNGFPSEF